MINKNKLIILFLASLVFVSCENTNSKKEKSLTSDDNGITEVISLNRESLTQQVSLPAELTPFRQVELFAKLNSYVKTLKVDIGDNVQEGQLLVELEAPELTTQSAAALSRIHSQEAIYTASNNTYQRLLETSKVEGTISKNDLDMALSKKNADMALLEAARASHKEIQIMQNYLQIRAPFAGKIAARNVNIGAMVGTGNQQPLLILEDQNTLRLVLSVPEAYSGYLTIGDQLSFSVNSLMGEKFEAKISRKAGSLDQHLRSERIELDYSNTGKKLLARMIATVVLPLKSNAESFAVPKSAVFSTTEGSYVIKINEGTAQYMNVETGLETSDKIAVFNKALNENDQLVLKASEKIQNGAVVKLSN